MNFLYTEGFIFQQDNARAIGRKSPKSGSKTMVW